MITIKKIYNNQLVLEINGCRMCDLVNCKGLTAIELLRFAADSLEQKNAKSTEEFIKAANDYNKRDR